MIFNLENRSLYVRLIILCGIIYPAWSFVALMFKSEAYVDSMARIPVGLIAILVGLFNKQLKDHFLLAIHISLTLIMVQFAFFLGQSGEERYIFASLVLIIGIFLGFLNYPREFLVHAFVSSVSFIGFTLYFDVFSKFFSPIRQIIMLYVAMYVITRISRSHANTIEKLRAERLQLLSERSEMITKNLQNAQSVFTALTSTQSDLPGAFKLKSFYKPADGAGGDWIGHFYLKEKNWLILTIGDVTGHDLASSLVTIAVAGAARGTFECLSHISSDLQTLVQQIALSSNLAVKNCGIKEKSMTAAFLGLNLTTFKGVYINCAHPSGLMQIQNSVVPLESRSSRFLGEDDFTAEVNNIDFSEMKSILLYTDGLVETADLPISEGHLTRWLNKSPNFYSEISTAFKDVALQDDVSFLLVEKQQ